MRFRGHFKAWAKRRRAAALQDVLLFARLLDMVPTHWRVSFVLPLVIATLVGVWYSSRFVATAQQRPSSREGSQGGESRPAPGGGDGVKAGITIQDALLRPYHFPFGEPTTLIQFCAQLKQMLKLPVVLDLAALERQDVERDALVQLELEGVRLKTGLKLLLDQVNLTYHVVPEDNLLIITDKQGSEDPLDRIWNALQALHRDVHDVQEMIDEIVVVGEGELEGGPMVRKPTIIEELPGQNNAPGGKDDAVKPKAEKPEVAPREPASPRGTRRRSPSRVPL